MPLFQTIGDIALTIFWALVLIGVIARGIEWIVSNKNVEINDREW